MGAAVVYSVVSVIQRVGMSLKENSVWSLPLEPNLFEPIVGIDLGTSNSCIAIWHKGKCRAKVLKNSNKRKKKNL